jgi:hypothetical protein
MWGSLAPSFSNHKPAIVNRRSKIGKNPSGPFFYNPG